MRQLMVRQVPEQRPTPTVAPVMHCVVETGRAVGRHIQSAIGERHQTQRGTGNGKVRAMSPGMRTWLHKATGKSPRVLTKLCRHDDSDGATKLHREAARRGVQRDAVSEVAHDVVAVCPQTDDDRGATEGQNPGRHRRLRANLSGAPDEIDGRERTDSTE